MAIHVKTGASTWTEVTNTAPNIRVKTGASTWTEASLVYVKTSSGWQLVWDNAATPPVYSSSSSSASGTGSPDKSSFTIVWTQPTIYSFSKYQFTSDGGATWGGDVTNAGLRTYTWTNLNSSTSYTFGVRTVTISGRFGEMLYTATTANGNPQPVTSGVTSGVTSSGMTISWTASTSTDLASTNRYEIWASGATSATFSQNGVSKAITGLSQNTTYTYTVYAVDSGGLKSSGVAISNTTTNANPPAPTLTGNYAKTHDTTSRTSTADVRKGLTWRVQYTGEAVSMIYSLWTWNGSSYVAYTGGTLYATNNRQTSVDTTLTFTGLLASTNYYLLVQATDANSGVTYSDLVVGTTYAAYEYERTASNNWYSTWVNVNQTYASANLKRSSIASNFDQGNVGTGNVNGWISGPNENPSNVDSYEWIAWPFDWATWAPSIPRYVTYNTRAPGGNLVSNTDQARWIVGFRYGLNTNAFNKDVIMYVSLGNGYDSARQVVGGNSLVTWNAGAIGTIPYTGGNAQNTYYMFTTQNATGTHSFEYIPVANYFWTQIAVWEGDGLIVRYTSTRLSTYSGYGLTKWRASAVSFGLRVLYSTITETAYYR
jgi:hypothetical protein